MKDDQKNTIKELSFDFALKTIKYANVLDEQRKYVISKQLLKSGTSIGANVREAQFAESRADFIHKLKISLKEANENHYWLELCKRSEE
ncbi:MAG TPA: four helix bundle protein [Bacteroidia bacterium]|jgi:four helix bundle protein|nr:four helix bundle protein [Bacteroidia bacterium]